MLDSTLVGGFPDEAFLVAGLDWLWPRIRHGKDRIDGMKIDVQGMEVECLRGCRLLVELTVPKLVIEMHRGVSRREILDLLAGLGYLASADPIERMPGEPTSSPMTGVTLFFPSMEYSNHSKLAELDRQRVEFAGLAPRYDQSIHCVTNMGSRYRGCAVRAIISGLKACSKWAPELAALSRRFTAASRAELHGDRAVEELRARATRAACRGSLDRWNLVRPPV